MGKFVILAILAIFVSQSFWEARIFLATFAILAKFAAFSRPFFAFSLHKSRILLNLLFLLFLRYLQVSVAQNFLVNRFFATISKKLSWQIFASAFNPGHSG